MANCNSLRHPAAARDALGNYTGFFINGTHAGKGVVNMATEAGDYVAVTKSPDDTFRICIESAAAIVVVLADDTQFTITAAQAGAHLGQWYPANIKKVLKTGTTGTFSVGW